MRQHGTLQVRATEDELSVGQQLEVMCLGKDNRGHVRLSRKAVLPPPDSTHNTFSQSSSQHSAYENPHQRARPPGLGRAPDNGRNRGDSPRPPVDSSEDEDTVLEYAKVGGSRAEQPVRQRRLPFQPPGRDR